MENEDNKDEKIQIQAEKKWNDESLLEDIIKVEYNKEGKDPSKSLNLLEEQDLKKLKEWKSLTEEEKKIFPLGLKKLLDEVASVIFYL